jgi:hypothetical protein
METVTSAKLILHIKTNDRTIHREFNNYAELFDYGCVALADLSRAREMYTHTNEQWASRGEHCEDFSDTDREPARTA